MHGLHSCQLQSSIHLGLHSVYCLVFHGQNGGSARPAAAPHCNRLCGHLPRKAPELGQVFCPVTSPFSLQSFFQLPEHLPGQPIRPVPLIKTSLWAPVVPSVKPTPFPSNPAPPAWKCSWSTQSPAAPTAPPQQLGAFVTLYLCIFNCSTLKNLHFVQKRLACLAQKI